MATREDNTPDAVLFYTGVGLAILGMACAGVAVIRAMLMKWWATLALVLGF